MLLAAIPSPDQGVWHLGPVPLRAYALCIVAGAVVALWLGDRRFQARGGRPGTVYDIAVWAIPFGLVGARLYHVVTTPELYFGEDGSLVEALYVWQGGLGIWGAVALGGIGAWIGCRQAGVRLPAFADAVAPGIVLAQGIGRWGNWFNQELFGRPTDLPWALEIDPANRPLDYVEQATFHPTYLYESLWDIGVALVVIVADRRFRMGHGRAFALYVALYTVGRTWIEQLRIDESLHPFGIRLNVFTSLVIFVLAVAYIVVSARLRPGREADPYREGRKPSDEPDASDAPVGGDVSAGTASSTATGAPGSTSGTGGSHRGSPGDLSSAPEPRPPAGEPGPDADRPERDER